MGEKKTKSKGMDGVRNILKSVVIQFFNFLHSLMKAGNAREIHKDFRRFIAVELASLLKSPWITKRSGKYALESWDFVLYDKIVDSVSEYVSMCNAFDIVYPPPIKDEKSESKQDEQANEQMDVDNADSEKKTEAKVISPARQSAITQLTNICDDNSLIEYALDSLHDSAPNNVQVAAEWIFTHQAAW